MHDVRDNLAEIIQDQLPASVSPADRGRIVTLCREFDRLGRVDRGTGRAAVDERRLRKLFDDHLGPAWSATFIEHVKREAPDLLSDTPGRAREVGLAALGRHVRNGKVAPDDNLEVLGLTLSSTPEEIRTAVKGKYPDVSDAALDPQVVHTAIVELARRTGRPVGSEPSNSGLTDELSDDWLGGFLDRLGACLRQRLWGWLWLTIGLAIIVLFVALAPVSFGLAGVFALTLTVCTWISGLFLALWVLECLLRGFGA